MNILLSDCKSVVRCGLKKLLTQKNLSVKIFETDTLEDTVIFLNCGLIDYLIINENVIHGALFSLIKHTLERSSNLCILTITESDWKLPSRGYENYSDSLVAGLNFTLGEWNTCFELFFSGEKKYNHFRKLYRTDKLVDFEKLDIEHLLSDREKIVVKLIASGMSLKAIAGELGISSSAVNTYNYRIRKKLNTRNIRTIISYASLLK